MRSISIFPFFLLEIALLVALGFDFVNGFHDKANAVAMVIYTHSLEPNVAVVWSGMWNFLGVLLSTGAVAFGIISLLPVELILQVGGGAGSAMVFPLLVAAIIWNLGTWFFGLRASSSHTLDRLKWLWLPRNSSDLSGYLSGTRSLKLTCNPRYLPYYLIAGWPHRFGAAFLYYPIDE